VKRAAFIFILACSYQMAHGGQEKGGRVPQTRFVRNNQGHLIQVAWVEGVANPIYIMPVPAHGPIVPAAQNAQPDDQDANNLGGLLCTIQ